MESSEKAKKILKSPPIVGLIAGIGVGGLVVLLVGFWYVGSDYFFLLLLPGSFLAALAWYLDDLIEALGLDFFNLQIDVYRVIILLMWYAQFGFFSGVVYWLLRKSLKSGETLFLLGLLLLASFLAIFVLNNWF